MIIYNVTIKIEKSIQEEWVQWMLNEHMPELYETGLFEKYQLCKLLEQDETEGITYTAQYYCHSLTEYEFYIQEYAKKMRDKGIARFGHQFIAFRTVMETVS